MGLENSRPLGLLEILQKASDAFDYATITEVWLSGFKYGLFATRK